MAHGVNDNHTFTIFKRTLIILYAVDYKPNKNRINN